VSSAATGIKGAVDKDVFFDQTMASLFSYMASNRKSVLADIMTSTSKSLADYPLTLGISDTLRYRDAGSLPAALASITEATGGKQQQADYKMNIARMKAYLR
jgi:hypothetical protein